MSANVNESKKLEEPGSKSVSCKNNTHLLPPVGVAIVFFTLLLAGNTLKQSFCGALPEVEHVTKNELKPQEKIEKFQPRNVCFEVEFFTMQSQLPVKGKTIEEHKSSKNIKLTKLKSETKAAGDISKRNATEPIIYLFALIFIYLLLKAASDINQHYKMQTNGNKRLRRCSLQSYAQLHKHEQRRASKGIAAKNLPKF